MSDKRPKLVNWREAMELSPQVFIQTENYFIESIRECASEHLTNYNYGLLQKDKRVSSVDDIQIRQHITGNIEVRVLRCNAITSSGVLIDFNPDDESEALVYAFNPKADTKANTQNWEVYICTNPLQRTPTGELNPSEDPPRHPDAEATYTIHVMPEGEIKFSQLGSHYLNIGRIRRNGESYTVNGDYIPPCVSMDAHTELMGYYHRFGAMLADLENHSKRIINKIFERKNDTALAGNICVICKDIMRYIAPIYFGYRNKGKNMPPVEILEYVAGLSHIIFNSLNFMPGPQRDEVLKYFLEWSDITPAVIRSTLAEMLEMNYDHEHIRSSMLRAEEVLSMLTELWENMSRLEYIGQHKESIVVSQERVSKNSDRTTWSVID